jgi:hypothetical protein
MRPVDIVKDVPPTEVDAEFWTDLINFQMRQGFAVRIDGSEPILGAPLFGPVNLINAPFGTFNFWVYIGETGIGVVDQGGIHSDITPAGYPGAKPGSSNSTLINGFPIQSFEDIPTFWDLNTANICQPLTGWPANTTTKAVRSSRQFLFALGMTENGVVLDDKLRWSNSAEPGTIPTEWDATPANDAGDTTLSATSGEIVDGQALRGQFIIYKSHSTYNANFTGGTFVWAFRKLFTTTGMLANNCVAEAFGVHYVLTDGDFIKHDGQNIVSLVDRKLRRFIFSQLDPTNFKNCFVFNNRSRKEIWACIVPIGETFAKFAVVYSYATELLSIRDIDLFGHAASGIVLDDAVSDQWAAQVDSWQTIARVWDEAIFTPAFENVLAGTPDDLSTGNPVLIAVDQGSTRVDGSVIGAVVSKQGVDFDMPNTFKHIKRLWPRVTGVGGTIIQVRVGGQITPDSGTFFTAFQDYIIGTTDFLAFDLSARYLTFEFRESLEQQPQVGFGINGFEVEFNLQGQFQ